MEQNNAAPWAVEHRNQDEKLKERLSKGKTRIRTTLLSSKKKKKKSGQLQKKSSGTIEQSKHMTKEKWKAQPGVIPRGM